MARDRLSTRRHRRRQMRSDCVHARHAFRRTIVRDRIPAVNESAAGSMEREPHAYPNTRTHARTKKTEPKPETLVNRCKHTCAFDFVPNAYTCQMCAGAPQHNQRHHHRTEHYAIVFCQTIICAPFAGRVHLYALVHNNMITSSGQHIRTCPTCPLRDLVHTHTHKHTYCIMRRIQLGQPTSKPNSATAAHCILPKPSRAAKKPYAVHINLCGIAVQRATCAAAAVAVAIAAEHSICTNKQEPGTPVAELALHRRNT